MLQLISLRTNTNGVLYVSYLETPLGKIRLIFSDIAMISLQFDDQPCLKQQTTIISDSMYEDHPIRSLAAKCLQMYFNNATLRQISLLLQPHGTAFQQSVWQQLLTIPFGKTLSYQSVAKNLGLPKHVRAVANAVAANPMLILIPCHRVIRSQGEIGGFSAGQQRKQWLLTHESRSKLS
jgi:methylated-DNA-[protein]-cysteine S-methyltransferase